MCVCANITNLLTVLADVRVDLIESAEHVELCGVESGLFCQIGIHVLVANGWQPVDVSVVPGDREGATLGITHRDSVSVKAQLRPKLFLSSNLWAIISLSLTMPAC